MESLKFLESFKSLESLESFHLGSTTKINFHICLQFLGNKTKTTVNIFIATNRTELMEEIDVMSTEDFIGNLGGSLGMFFGFSLASPLTFIMRIILNKLFQSVSSN